MSRDRRLSVNQKPPHRELCSHDCATTAQSLSLHCCAECRDTTQSASESTSRGRCHKRPQWGRRRTARRETRVEVGIEPPSHGTPVRTANPIQPDVAWNCKQLFLLAVTDGIVAWSDPESPPDPARFRHARIAACRALSGGMWGGTRCSATVSTGAPLASGADRF